MSETAFRTIAENAQAELEEKRSVFLAAVRRVSEETEAEAFVRERRRAHPDARHTVFAYLLRKGTARYSDDAEPQGTAGMPVLEAIRRAGLTDVIVVVTRYFGGNSAADCLGFMWKYSANNRAVYIFANY